LLLARLLLAGDGAARALAGAGVGLRALAVDGQATAVAQALVAADLDLAADVGLDLTAEVTLDLEVVVHVLAELDEVLLGKIADARVRVDPGDGERLLGTGAPDAEDVGESDLDALVAREIDACE